MSNTNAQNLQINTDISPIISPKSNTPGAFITPKDNILVNFNANKTQNQHPHDDQHLVPDENHELEEDIDGSNRFNNSDTNESYSIDRENAGENNALPEGANYYTNLLVINDNSTERELHYEEDHNRPPPENMCILEFEEFVIDKLPKKPEPEASKPEPVREENIPIETPQEKKEDTPPKPISAPKNTKKKGFSFPTITIDDDVINPAPKMETKVEKTELPLQEGSFRTKPESGNDSGRGPKSFGSKPEIPKVEKIETVEKIEPVIQHVQDTKKDEEIENLKKELSLLKQQLNEKEDAISKLKESNQKAKENPFKQENSTLLKKNEELVKENATLKQDLGKANQELKEIDLENLRMGEKIENQRDFILKLEEKYVNLENINFSLDKDIKGREALISALEAKVQVAEEKKSKYKNLSKQKEEQIKDLKAQEEQNKNAPNELYISMAEKTKIYKDKITQMTRQMEDQKEVIKSKDNAIENLLSRMDELTAALASKNDEISSIKFELSNLKDEFELLKNERRPKNASLTKTKSLSATANNSQSREREKQAEVIPTHKKGEKSLTISSKAIDNLKKSNDPFQLVEKLKIQANTPKPVFQSYDFNDRIKRSDDDIGGKTWGTMNLKEALRQEREESEYNDALLQKPSKKSLDFDSNIKPAPVTKHVSTPQHHKSQGEDTRNTHDIQELQKRLAYLKTKRLEFEKKKYGLGMREDSHERVKEDNLSLTQTLPNIKSLIGTIKFTSPTASAKKIDHSSHSDLWHENSKDRDSIQINNFLQDNTNNVLFRSNQTNPSVGDDGPYSRGSSKNPSKRYELEPGLNLRPPKIDNYQANPNINNFNRTETSKNSTRYSSANSTSSASKNEYYPSYAHKKSYDSNANPKNDIMRNNESPMDRNSQRTRDFKDFLYRGSMTPSAQLQASIMERLMDNKTRK